MPTTKALDTQKVDQLKHQIKGFVDYSWGLHIHNERISTALVGTGLVLVATVSIVAFLGYSMLAGIISIIAGMVIAIQNAYNFAEKADYYKIIHVDAKALRDYLNYKVDSTKDFEAVIDTLAVLRRQLAVNLPKGSGMEEVKKLSATLPKL